VVQVLFLFKKNKFPARICGRSVLFKRWDMKKTSRRGYSWLKSVAEVQYSGAGT
jgi:hypothetical protein